MSGFAALLKLSQSQTAQSELEVKAQIASHQVQLEKKRREQEAKERKERELEAKMRAKRFEEERKEEERKRKRAEEENARERELAKREEQMRHALKYGPRKPSSAAPGPSKGKGSDNGGESGGGPAFTREEMRKRQNEAPEPHVLTREEKRERRLAAEIKRTASTSSRRSGGGSGRTASLPNGRMVRRLPGGAVDVTTVSRLADPDAPPALPSGDMAGKSARERLAAMPSTLLKLNTVKRDVRTIDEILIDRAKAKQAKVLAGDEAKEFSDWFGKSKKKEREKAASQSSAQQQPASLASSPTGSPTPSGSPTPAINPFHNAAAAKTKSAVLTTPSKSSSPFLKSINPRSSTVSRPSGVNSSLSSFKKRPRSPSDSDTALPSVKRRPANSSRPAAASSRPAAPSRPAASSSRSSRIPNGMGDLSSEIWSIFGKDKKSYVARDVLSDDEDMEADAESVLKEEARSARLAHKEDEYALAEERRHEDDKRRRKKERERRERA